MPHDSCPGYAAEPFATLVAEYPGEDVYPPGDFRTEWGPVFHRGRLDGSARVVVLGQDPAAHEAVARRILVGEAGQRVQGLLARVGITSRCVMVNTFLYSVYGQAGGKHVVADDVVRYRNRWLDAVTGPSVTALVTLGTLAATAADAWLKTRPDLASLHVAKVKHPTYPESAAGSGGKTLAQTTALLLADWNAHLPALHAAVVPEVDTPLRLYGDTWADGDLSGIPEADLPAGCPAWMRGLAAWATRTGADPQSKRATITVAVPRAARTWPPV